VNNYSQEGRFIKKIRLKPKMRRLQSGTVKNIRVWTTIPKIRVDLMMLIL